MSLLEHEQNQNKQKLENRKDAIDRCLAKKNLQKNVLQHNFSTCGHIP